MQIFDTNGNLLAQKIVPFSTSESKQFFTEDELDFQVASFVMKKNENIERHIHNKQDRIINTTSEAIILIEGKLEIELFDSNLQFVQSVEIVSGEIIVLFHGGHFMKIVKDSKFIEIKQGPYIEQSDKFRF